MIQMRFLLYNEGIRTVDMEEQLERPNQIKITPDINYQY